MLLDAVFLLATVLQMVTVLADQACLDLFVPPASLTITRILAVTFSAMLQLAAIMAAVFLQLETVLAMLALLDRLAVNADLNALTIPTVASVMLP